MYLKKRSWQRFGMSVAVLGAGIIGLGALFFSVPDNFYFTEALVMVAIGGVIFGAGLWVLIWDWKIRKKDTNYKIDKSLQYVFTLVTETGTETVTDYAQMEQAFRRLGEWKSGFVRVEIAPAMGSILSIETIYDAKSTYFQSYLLQQRKDGQGYWVLLSESVWIIANQIKRLYLKKKQVDFSCYNRKETGEGIY